MLPTRIADGILPVVSRQIFSLLRVDARQKSISAAADGEAVATAQSDGSLGHLDVGAPRCSLLWVEVVLSPAIAHYAPEEKLGMEEMAAQAGQAAGDALLCAAVTLPVVVTPPGANHGSTDPLHPA
ncbi:MAG: hypothetical protein TE42_10145 [Candidatus Synechococcus spongiarum SP3]|uniref:Uncharacterized protein n=1 Tax=Candidatus Synechococcus spongiarum SP3 TaxID=1604020 RepID=A0A0G2J3Z8_9SYNE|nr:MAG: hypothetical protein TE42_10145 [Candidatus Synechococcus spongiarum SP3]